MLSVQDPVVDYGSTQVVKEISFGVNQGEIATLIGANGAGKTMTLHAAPGLVETKSGSASFCDHNPLSTKPHKILGLNMARVPESRRVFSRMMVMENLQMGAYIRNDASGISEDYDMAFKCLPRLKERRKQAAGTLSGGEQQTLAIGRVLMGRSKMLLLDEPSMSPSPLLVGEILKTISDVNESGVTVLLVEQSAKKALEIVDHAYILETGEIVVSGDVLELVDSEEVCRVYLGG